MQTVQPICGVLAADDKMDIYRNALLSEALQHCKKGGGITEHESHQLSFAHFELDTPTCIRCTLPLGGDHKITRQLLVGGRWPLGVAAYINSWLCCSDES